MITTLERIRAESPCAEGWSKLLAYLDKTKADNEPLPLSVVLESNGLDDTLWCFRAVEGLDREQRLFAVWCARQVEHLMFDRRSLEALAMAERYANGLASVEELDAAHAAANAAAKSARANKAARATIDAAWAASDASEAAWTAVTEIARTTAWTAVQAMVQTSAQTSAIEAQIQELKRVLACTEAGIDPYPPKE